MSGDYRDIKDIKEWMRRLDVPEGYTFANAAFSREFKNLNKDLKAYSRILYLVGVNLGNYNLRTLMMSASKQAKFCQAIIIELEHKRVDEQHIWFFNRNVKSINERLEYIEKIANENLRLTKYGPFFEQFDAFSFDGEDAEMYELANKWVEEHEEEVRKHMEEIRPELEIHEEFLRRKKEAAKEERAARRAARKAENAEVREMKKNAERHRAELRKEERSFQRYYEGKY